jgi:LSD1 subclass zinc finger protein
VKYCTNTAEILPGAKSIDCSWCTSFTRVSRSLVYFLLDTPTRIAHSVKDVIVETSNDSNKLGTSTVRTKAQSNNFSHTITTAFITQSGLHNHVSCTPRFIPTQPTSQTPLDPKETIKNVK